ncbi:MAG: lasso peptide biosynthesis B2 protein [Porticoccaceae bacterium]
MTLSEKISHLLKLPAERKLWLLVFFIGSLLSWFAIRISNSQTLASKMGDQHLQNRTLCVLVNDEQAAMASRMGKLMYSVSKNVPWESKCLTDALCVKWLLDRYKIPAVFYLGARINNDKTSLEAMQAHAWLSVGPFVVTGAPEHLDFQVVATFVSPAMEPPAP